VICLVQSGEPSLQSLTPTSLSALGFAHSKGVLHRDLKPENIMLGEFGEVHVLDWGLAMVQGMKEDAGSRGGVAAASRILPSSDSSKTVDGTVFGTPHFMAPEQATGRFDLIDARTDIYSLGAILYNILTLATPIEGATADQALANAAQNRVLPPEERTPDREIPRELSAIAMKCLAADRADRYQSVAELRRDIDLFLEGRSVSARPDTLPQAFWRLIVRHKTISIAAAIIVVLVVVFDIRVIAEGRRAERALAALRSAAPMYQGQARTLMTQAKYEDALDRISRAMEFDPDNADYHALAGNLFQVFLRLRDARNEYAKVLALNPQNASATLNLRLCEEILRRDGDAVEPSDESLRRLSQSLRQQNRFEEAIAIAQRTAERKQTVLTEWKTRFDAAGITPRSLVVLGDDTLAVDLRRAKLTDLAPLKGMPIATLDIAHTSVANLEPLRGMALEWLILDSTKVTDLGPLHGMALKRLSLANVRCFDLKPLKGMPLVLLSCEGSDVTDLTPLQGMHLESFAFSPKKIVKGIRTVRGMKSIRQITNHLESPDRGWMRPDIFWKKYDDGEFK